VKEPAVVARVGREEVGVGFRRGGRERVTSGGGGIGLIIARADGQQQSDGVGVVDGEGVVAGRDAAAVGKRAEVHRESGAALGATAGHRHRVGARGPRHRVHPTEQGAKCDQPRPARGEADHQHAVGGAAKYLARVRDAAALERRARHGGVEVEFAPVVAGVGDVGLELQPQVAERLEAAVVGPRRRGQIPLREGLGLGVLAGEEEFAQSRQSLQHLGLLHVPGAARPHAALIEPKQLAVRSAVHERADAAVADGQGFVPGARRLAVPEDGRGGRGGRGGRTRRRRG
jgi:hypothetical protein